MTVSLTLANRVQAETVSRSGLQLYSLRDDMERNVKAMLRTHRKESRKHKLKKQYHMAYKRL